MPSDYPIEIEAGTTFRLVLYFQIDLTGCKLTTQFRRTVGATAVEFQFTSTPAAGWTIGQLTSDLILPSGRRLPSGTWFASLRIERSVTSAMSGSYWHATELEHPIGSFPEPDTDQPMRGPVTIIPEGVR